MPSASTVNSRTSEVAILGRLLTNGEEMTPELAHYFLKVGFTEEDKTRMHELAVKNQDGALTAEERKELEAYVKAGCLLGILHSRARRALKKTGKT